MDRNVHINEVKGQLELDKSVLPIFQQWKQENESWIPNFNIWSYLNLRGDFDLAAAFSKLFFPDFVEVDGCVLLKEQYSPEGLSRWMKSYDGNTRAVEAMMNHVHIWDRFLNSPRDVEYPEHGLTSEKWTRERLWSTIWRKH